MKLICSNKLFGCPKLNTINIVLHLFLSFLFFYTVFLIFNINITVTEFDYFKLKSFTIPSVSSDLGLTRSLGNKEDSVKEKKLSNSFGEWMNVVVKLSEGFLISDIVWGKHKGRGFSCNNAVLYCALWSNNRASTRPHPFVLCLTCLTRPLLKVRKRHTVRPFFRNTGQQFEIPHFLVSVGDCNLILRFHVGVNWQLSKRVFADQYHVTHRGFVFFKVMRRRVNNFQLAGSSLSWFLWHKDRSIMICKLILTLNGSEHVPSCSPLNALAIKMHPSKDKYPSGVKFPSSSSSLWLRYCSEMFLFLDKVRTNLTLACLFYPWSLSWVIILVS